MKSSKWAWISASEPPVNQLKEFERRAEPVRRTVRVWSGVSETSSGWSHPESARALARSCRMPSGSDAAQSRMNVRHLSG
jgi:hypothetical protein